MGRRKILLPLAAVIAAVGTLMVFLYVQGAEGRAADKYDAVEVLRVVKPIEPGEKFDDAARESKFQLQTVARDQVLSGSQTDLTSLSGTVATQKLFAGEQVIADKWGAVAEAASALTIPKDMLAISVNLTDPGRVAGFVNPGSEVADLRLRYPNRRLRAVLADADAAGAGSGHRRDVDNDVHQDQQGRRSDHRGDPPDADDPRGRAERRPAHLLRRVQR